ncbi:hypothetical protein RRG08_048800 [Elysia crispata]|uniref:Uncharacterized protein n=1 Tax=Elysia crispata TaxID=231223 RepID=A0AAE1AP11_9GAST|nr:hypothetical protein RRG08_048800 [Elysia crispata]
MCVRNWGSPQASLRLTDLGVSLKPSLSEAVVRGNARVTFEEGVQQKLVAYHWHSQLSSGLARFKFNSKSPPKPSVDHGIKHYYRLLDGRSPLEQYGRKGWSALLP